MKKIQKSVLMLLAVAFIMPACKKGENDPAISLRSRKARVEGEWTVSKMESTRTTTPTCTGCTVSTTKTTFDGTTKTVVETNGSNVDTDIYSVSENSLVVEKDGNYKWTETETLTSYNGNAATGSTPSTSVDEGVWNFTGGAGDTKKKSELVLVNTKSTSTYGSTSTTSTSTGSPFGVIFMIDQLKNKEMILKVVSTDVYGTPSTTSVTETTYTLTQE